MMITYQSTQDDFHNIIDEFGRVSYGLYSKSEDLLREYQEQGESLIQKIEILRQLCPLIAEWCEDYCYRADHRVIAMEHVVELGHLEFLCDLYPDDERLIEYVCKKGYLEVLRKLRDGSLGMIFPWSEYACAHAASYGHLEVLRALRDGSLGGVCPWSEHACAYAAGGGHVEILRALRDGSLGGVCPWNTWASEYAVLCNQLEILRLLRNGYFGEKCPWNKWKCRHWVARHPEIIRVIDSGELD